MLSRRKIRFIEPQSRPGRPFNVWVSRWPLLGPITLATILDQLGFDVGVYNENISGPLPENPQALEDICSADVVGLSIMTPTAARGYELAALIRRQAPQATLAFGGAHATFRPEEAAEHGDVVVCGEGEAVIEALASGQIRQGIVHSPPLENLDAIPTLKHSLMRDFDKLVAGCRGTERYQLPIMTSRGCPHNCTYCSVTRMFGHKVRRQSLEKARADLECYARRGFRHVFFYDDNFTSDRNWSKQVLSVLASLGMRFNAQVRIDFPWLDDSRRRLDRDLLHLMGQAGGDVLYIGYETIDEETARHWNKGYRGEDSLESRLRLDTRVIHDAGLWIHGMFVFGPQDSARTAQRVVQFARANEIETIQITMLTPFPGTPLYEQMGPDLLLHEYPADWNYYDGAHCVYGRDADSIRSLHQILIATHQRFYRFGGWSSRRIKAFWHEPGTMREKLSLLWTSAGWARTTMRLWQQENQAFVRMLCERLGQRVPCPSAS